MEIALDQTDWEIVDDAAWTRDWVGLSSGDVYRGADQIATYVAAWYPNTNRPLQLLVTLWSTQPSRPTISVALRCNVGEIESLVQVGPNDVPWDSDGIVTGPIPEAGAPYTRAEEALPLAREIIALDPALRKYVNCSSLSICHARNDHDT